MATGAASKPKNMAVSEVIDFGSFAAGPALKKNPTKKPCIVVLDVEYWPP
jgi:hypothetical protein